MGSFLKPIFTALRVTPNVVRILLIATAGMAIVTAYLRYSYAEISHKPLALTDFIASIAYGMAALLFAWLGFSEKGKDVLADGDGTQVEASTRNRLPKVFVASIGIAGGIWLVLIVLSLILSGPDMVVRLFDGWVILVLIAVSFPIAYKWLK